MKLPQGTGGNLADGADAVKAALVREFGAINIIEGHDLNTQDVLLDFEADWLGFRVRISHAYDNHYSWGQITVCLQELGALLRASKNGRARVMLTGIAFE